MLKVGTWLEHLSLKRRWGGVIFKAFEIRGGGSDFSHKKGGVGKIG